MSVIRDIAFYGGITLAVVILLFLVALLLWKRTEPKGAHHLRFVTDDSPVVPQVPVLGIDLDEPDDYCPRCGGVGGHELPTCEGLA